MNNCNEKDKSTLSAISVVLFQKVLGDIWTKFESEIKPKLIDESYLQMFIKKRKSNVETVSNPSIYENNEIDEIVKSIHRQSILDLMIIEDNINEEYCKIMVDSVTSIGIAIDKTVEEYKNTIEYKMNKDSHMTMSVTLLHAKNNIADIINHIERKLDTIIEVKNEILNNLNYLEKKLEKIKELSCQNPLDFFHIELEKLDNEGLNFIKKYNYKLPQSSLEDIKNRLNNLFYEACYFTPEAIESNKSTSTISRPPSFTM